MMEISQTPAAPFVRGRQGLGGGLAQFGQARRLVIKPGMRVPGVQLGNYGCSSPYAYKTQEALLNKYLRSDPQPGFFKSLEALGTVLVDWVKSGTATKAISQMLTYDFPGMVQTQTEWGAKVVVSPGGAGYRPPRDAEQMKAWLEEVLIATFRIVFLGMPNGYFWPDSLLPEFRYIASGTLYKGGFNAVAGEIKKHFTAETMMTIGYLAFDRNPGDAKILKSLPLVWMPAPTEAVKKVFPNRGHEENSAIATLTTAYGQAFSIDPYIDYRDRDVVMRVMRAQIGKCSKVQGRDGLSRIFEGGNFGRYLFLARKVWFTAGSLPGENITQKQKALKVLSSVETTPAPGTAPGPTPTPGVAPQCQGVVDSVAFHLKNAENHLRMIQLRFAKFKQFPKDAENNKKLGEVANTIKSQGVPALIQLARKLRECKSDAHAKNVEDWRATSERDANTVIRVLTQAAGQQKEQQTQQAAFFSQCNTAIAALPSHLESATNTIKAIKMRHAVFNQNPHDVANNKALTQTAQAVKSSGIQSMINLARQYRTCKREDLAQQIEGKRVEVERTANAALGALMVEAARRRVAAAAPPQLPVTTL